MQSLYSHETDVYNLKGFKPQIVDADYLKQLGVTVEPSEETLQGLIPGSKLFMKRLEEHTVIPKSMLYLEDCDPNTIETEIHNYTGRCPTLTFEVNPIKGCHVGCQYCLVTDGVHEQKLVAYENYHLYVRNRKIVLFLCFMVQSVSIRLKKVVGIYAVEMSPMPDKEITTLC